MDSLKRGAGEYMKVYTGGTFDTPHLGHYNFLKKCSKFGEVTVSLNTDEFIQSYKGIGPLYNYEERKALLELIPFVNKVVPNTGGHDSKVAILKAMPDVIVIGSDWAYKDYYSQMDFNQDWLDEHDIGLVYVPYTKLISTSDIKRRVRESDSSSHN